MSTKPTSSAPDASGARGPVVPIDGAINRGTPRRTNVYEPDHKWNMKVTFAIGLVAIAVIVGVALFIVNRPDPKAAPGVATTTIPFATTPTSAGGGAPPSIDVLGGGGSVEQIKNGTTANADVALEPSSVGVSPDGGGPDRAVLVGDQKRHGIVKLANGKVVLLVGITGSPLDQLQGVGATLQRPDHLVVDNAGDAWFSDQSRLLFKIDALGAVVRVGADPLQAPSSAGSKRLVPVTGIGGLALDRTGRLHVATDSGIYRVDGQDLVLEAGGGSARGDDIPALGAELKDLRAFAMAPDDTMYVVDGSRRVRRIDPLGTLTTLPGLPGGQDLTDLAVDRAGTLFGVDAASRQVWQLTGDAAKPVVGSGREGFPKGATAPLEADMTRVERFSIDGAGTMYLADAGTGRVYRVTGVAAG